jgi:hypothetical protein
MAQSLNLLPGITRPSATVTPNPLTYMVDSTGAHLFPVQLVDAAGNAYKTLIFKLMPDTTTWLDPSGAVIASPPAALTAFATATVNYESKRDAAFSAPGVQAILALFA